MIEVSMELVVVLFVVGLVVALSSSPSFRSALLTIFGVLGFGIIAMAVIAFIFVVRSVNTHRPEVMRFDAPFSPAVEVQEIQLDGSQSLVTTRTSQIHSPKPKTVVAKKPVSAPAPATDTTAIEDLPVRTAEEIRIDDQTRAEIEQQWREGELHDRLIYTGTGAGTLIALLATLFGYLKLDLLSQAKHRRGLQAGAAGVILTVALVAALAAEGRLGF